MSDWQQWKYINKEKIQHIAGYEEKFVDEILSKISEITPDDVIPQYHFTDSKNGNRYIDFMILNKSKGYSLPIELDGYDKINNKGYQKFNDFLERQNDLIKEFGLVLRYTNRKAFEQSNIVIKEIRQALNDQATKKISEQSKRLEVERLIQEYVTKIAEYEDKLKHSNTPPTQQELDQIEQAKKDLGEFKENYEERIKVIGETIIILQKDQKNDIKNIKNALGVVVGAVALMIIGAIMYLKPSTSKNAIVQPQTLVSTSTTLEPAQAQVSRITAIEEQPAIEQQKTIVTEIKANQKQPATEQQIKANNLPKMHLASTEQESAVKPTVDVLPPASELKRTNIIHQREIVEPKQLSRLVTVDQVQNFIGENKTVCGEVSQISNTKKATYINFGGRYPKQQFSAVIWSNGIETPPEGSNICIKGLIKSYKGTPQIVISSFENQVSSN